MRTVDLPSSESDLVAGNHVCWFIADSTAFFEAARSAAVHGAASGQKVIVFAPRESALRSHLGEAEVVVVDPHVDVLGRGSLDPDAMFAMFRARAAEAHASGYAGLRVIAEMDWMLPVRPSSESIIAFEISLDRVINELDVTVICAYRADRFEPATMCGVHAVHPTAVGSDAPSQFQLVSQGTAAWTLSGEVDVAVGAAFEAAYRVAACSDTPNIDIASLEFIDVSGLRAIVRASNGAPAPIRLHGARPSLSAGVGHRRVRRSRPEHRVRVARQPLPLRRQRPPIAG